MDEFRREIFCHWRLVADEGAIGEHDLHGAGVVEHHVENCLAGAAFADDSLEHRRAGSAPVFRRDAGFLLERLAHAFEDILLHGAVDDDLSFFFAFGDKLRVLGESG